MGAVRRGYARRFGAAADTCCALRQCRFVALTLFVAPILPARSIRCSRHVPQLGVLLRPLVRYPSWVPVVLSGPMMGTHCIQPIAFVTECRRFGLIQFPSLRLPFFILALRLFHHSRSLLSAGCKFDFCRIATCGIAWAVCGNARHARNYRYFLLSLPSFLGFSHLLFVLAPGLLRVYCWCLLEQFALA